MVLFGPSRYAHEGKFHLESPMKIGKAGQTETKGTASFNFYSHAFPLGSFSASGHYFPSHISLVTIFFALLKGNPELQILEVLEFRRHVCPWFFETPPGLPTP